MCGMFIFSPQLQHSRAGEKVYDEAATQGWGLTCDVIRFHAWQSSLLFTFLFLIHLIFSFSKFVSYALLVLDLGLIAFLALHAYRDADSLERWEVPWIGRLASSFVDEE